MADSSSYIIYELPGDGNHYFYEINDTSDNTEVSLYQIDVAKVVISLIICILGLIGNLVAIFVILVLKEFQKSVTHWYVLQLAIADSIFLLTLPFKVSEDLKGQWIFSDAMCKGKETILFLNYYASILFLMVMSLDRYIAVCHTFSDNLLKMRKRVSAFIIAMVIWAVSLLLCIPVMLYSFKIGSQPICKCSYEFPTYDSDTTRCREEGFNDEISLKRCLEIISTYGSTNRTTDEPYCKRFEFEGNGSDVFSASRSGEIEINPDELLAYEYPFEHDYYPNSLSVGDLNETANSLNDNHGLPNHDIVHSACHYWERSDLWYFFLAFNFTVMFILPLIVMVVCYGLIVRRLSTTRMRSASTTSTVSFTSANGTSQHKRRKTSSRSDKNRRRVTIMCGTLVSSFVICWLPFHAVHLAKIVGIQNTSAEVCAGLLVAGSILGYLNSALNPYLYSFLGTNFTRRWRLLKKSRGIRHFISVAAWKHGDSSGSNRNSQAKGGKNRNGSQQGRAPFSTNNQTPLPTMTTKLSMAKYSSPAVPQQPLSENPSAEEAVCRSQPSEPMTFPTQSEM